MKNTSISLFILLFSLCGCTAVNDQPTPANVKDQPIAPGAAQSATALDPARPPSGNFDLSHWDLTLPDSKPTTIRASRIAAGYTSPNFYTGDDGAMVFWSPSTGGHTANSTHTRSELREQIDPVTSHLNWHCAGDHIMHNRCKVLQVGETGEVIIGQIHGAPSGANPVCKIYWTKGQLTARCHTDPSSSREPKYALGKAPLGSMIDYTIEMKDGLLIVTAGGVTATQDDNAGWGEAEMYFKAGCYNQDIAADQPDTVGCRVAFYSLPRPVHTPTDPAAH
jgi:hypothetical protein